MNYLFIMGTILFTVYGQIVLKWRMLKYGTLPKDFQNRLLFVFNLFLDPYILSVFLSAFLAYLCWMVAMTKFELSFAYPFMSLSFILVLISSTVFFSEPITIGKVLGLLFIIIGLIVSVKY